MGRPTKEEVKKRAILLKYFRRDSDIYTSFETAIEGLNQDNMIGMLIDQCKIRDFKGDKNLIPKKLYINELNNIDKDIHLYYIILSSISNSLNIEDIGIDSFYSLHYYISKSLLIKIFGEKRANMFSNEGYYGFYLDAILSNISKDEDILLKKYISKNRIFDLHTIIHNMVGRYSYNDSSLNHLVELDFDKPKKDILEHVEYLIDEYHKGRLPNAFKHLNINKYTIPKEDIYKTNFHKPFNIVLADKLFIYDSYKIGLTHDEVINEIENYSTNIKKVNIDKVTQKTIIKYRKEMIYLIDKKGYLNFEKTQIK